VPASPSEPTLRVALEAEIRRRRWTQAEAAREIDVHPSRLNRWLVDGTEPEVDAYDALCRFLSVDRTALAVLLMASRVEAWHAADARRNQFRGT
jgi:transcriptional regulator with XRE-family HTH domain